MVPPPAKGVREASGRGRRRGPDCRPMACRGSGVLPMASLQDPGCEACERVTVLCLKTAGLHSRVTAARENQQSFRRGPVSAPKSSQMILEVAGLPPIPPRAPKSMVEIELL